jgi:hypothetical protein
MPEAQEIRQGPTEGRGVALLALDQVAYKQGVHLIMAPHAVRGRQRDPGVA